jgi:hypothetical protein
MINDSLDLPSEHQLTCRYFSNGNCLLIAQLVGNLVAVKSDACKVCTEHSERPRQVNNVIASLTIGWIRKHNRTDLKPILDRLTSYLTLVPRKTIDDVGEGPGIDLHWVLKDKGFEIEPGCKCLYQIEKMNKNGARWCVENIEETVSVMVKEARRRKFKILRLEPPDKMLRKWSRRYHKQAIERWLRRSGGLDKV